MRRTQYGRRKRLMAEINVVPYIDVMLVLLVIFMVTAPLLSQGIKVDLPKVAAASLPDHQIEPFVVTIDRDGAIYLNDDEKKITNPREIEIKARAVLSRYPDLPFLVRADGTVNFSFVVEAMVLLKQAGVPSVGMVTELPGS